MFWDGGLSTADIQWRLLHRPPAGSTAVIRWLQGTLARRTVLTPFCYFELCPAQQLLTNSLLGFFFVLFRLLPGIGGKKQGKNDFWIPFALSSVHSVAERCPKASVSNIHYLFWKTSSHTFAYLNITRAYRGCKNKYFSGLKFSHWYQDSCIMVTLVIDFGSRPAVW